MQQSKPTFCQIVITTVKKIINAITTAPPRDKTINIKKEIIPLIDFMTDFQSKYFEGLHQAIY